LSVKFAADVYRFLYDFCTIVVSKVLQSFIEQSYVMMKLKIVRKERKAQTS